VIFDILYEPSIYRQREREMRIAQDDRVLLQDIVASVIVPSSHGSLDEILQESEIEQRTTLYFGEAFELPF